MGHSKDHRPDLPQLKLVFASLDPLGLPLATEVLSGEHADDPVYLPIITRVRDGLQKHGLLSVGDCKMAVWQTRATLQAQGDYSLCPLSAVQLPPEQLYQAIEAQRKLGASVVQVMRTDEQGACICLAQGFEAVQTLSMQVDEHQETWQERRLLVPSLAATQAAQQGLQNRLQQAQQAPGSIDRLPTRQTASDRATGG
jgi:Transposase